MAVKVTNYTPRVFAKLLSIINSEGSPLVRKCAQLLRDYNIDVVKAIPGADYDGNALKANAPSTIRAKRHNRPLIGDLRIPRTMTSKTNYRIQSTQGKPEAVVFPLAKQYFRYVAGTRGGGIHKPLAKSRKASGGLTPTGANLREVINYVRQKGYVFWGIPTTKEFRALITQQLAAFGRNVLRRFNGFLSGGGA